MRECQLCNEYKELESFSLKPKGMICDACRRVRNAERRRKQRARQHLDRGKYGLDQILEVLTAIKNGTSIEVVRRANPNLTPAEISQFVEFYDQLMERTGVSLEET